MTHNTEESVAFDAGWDYSVALDAELEWIAVLRTAIRARREIIPTPDNAAGIISLWKTIQKSRRERAALASAHSHSPEARAAFCEGCCAGGLDRNPFPA